jgi:hypothetical protein
LLRGLARTGNVRASAAEAGVDPGTAYDHRVKDARFAAQWAAALPKGKARAARLHAGTCETVVRRTKHGTQLVRAAAGRWSAKVEEVFLAELERTACARRAAAACGLSTTALYQRRKHYPDFAARWAAAEEKATARIPGLLAAATIASFDPEAEDRSAPRVKVAEAIAILRLKGGGGAGGGAGARRGRGRWRREMSIEEVREEVLRRLKAIRDHREARGG